MSRKSKGINAEREIIHMFWQTGQWAAFRVAGSGSSHYPSPDIIASNGKKVYAIECKASKKGYNYIEKAAIEDLKLFSRIFGAEALIAARFDKKGWYFFSLDKLKETEKNFMLDIKMAESIGSRFDGVVG